VTGAVGAALLLSQACSPREVAPPSAPTGGTLTATIRAEPRSFNAYIGQDAAGAVIAFLMHSKLVRVNRATQEIEPRLAEAWTCTEDATRCTLKLRRNVTFSDGTPFTAADVLFSFAAAYDEKTGSPLGEALRVDHKPLQVAATDDHTLTITFPAPFGAGLRLLDNLPILPRHRLEPRLAAGTLRDAWNLTTSPSEMAGLGPFVLAEYTPGQRVVFTRNGRYWLRANDVPLPYLDRIVLEIVPDRDAELLRLQSGQTDLTQTEIRPGDYLPLKREADAGRLRLIDLGVGLDADGLWFNLRKSGLPPKATPPRWETRGGDPGGGTYRSEWLQSLALRRAISLAVDRKAFVDTVFLGAGVPVGGPITPGNKAWHSAAVAPDPHDPGRARALLSQAGLSDRNGDGLLEDVRRQPARFTILTQKGNTALERGAAFIRDELRKVGLVVEIAALEVGTLVQRLTKGDYEAIYFRLLATDTDPAVNLDFWMSAGSAHVWNPEQNAPATAWERRMDELMAEQARAVDRKRRKELMDEVQALFAEQIPIVYFAAPQLYVATSARVEHATPGPFPPTILWNAEVLKKR
jgi:peptide/nickel transport system substrate-binding protein